MSNPFGNPIGGPAVSSTVNAVGQIGGMYYDALNSDYEQYFQDMAPGVDTYTNIGDLSSQEFQREGFQFGDIVKGLGAGASAGAAIGATIGSVAPGVGTAIGAGVGVLAGTGSAIIKNIQQNRARQAFEQQRSEAIRGAEMRNRMIDARRMTAKNIGVDLREQYDMFY